MEKSQLHHCQVHKKWAILNRLYASFHLVSLAAILYYRAAFFFHRSTTYYYYYMVPLLPWLLIFGAELILSFMWILKLSFNWRPVTRTVFPDNLPEDEALPGIDVFICTADPDKEPTFDVMNTVISAMSLDYPVDKLSVYVSDDGGASVTLYGMKQAWVFATWWLPFCKRYNVKPISPKAYFEQMQEDGPIQIGSREFVQDTKIVKEKYEIFKQRVCGWKTESEIVSDGKRTPKDHPPIIQVINEKSIEDDDGAISLNPNLVEMPLLVYIAREKRPSYPHHFKAGALNVLQRVSSIMSNSPYILVLDCDMYCDDSTSARQAMCFYVDSNISSSLAWVQFAQKFHNISKNDIYDSQMITLWPVTFPGVDGLQGPLLAGTNFYINRKALYGFTIKNGGNDTSDQRCTFGTSNEFIKSLTQIDKPKIALKPREVSSDHLQEAQFLASCVYEEDTQWGTKVGFRYDSVVEDVFTGFILHSQGWKSVYLNPPKPQFLGAATTNLNETCVQGSRWVAGLLQLGLSNCCPLFYTSPTNTIHILQRMFYSWAALFPLEFLPISCFAIISPICFFYGIPLYPKVSDPFFIPFAFVFISSRLKLVFEVFLSGGSIQAWLNVQRIAIIKGITCYAYGSLICVMAKLGIREASFIPTNKAGDEDTTKWYQIGKYDFRTSNMFLIPIVTAAILNLSSFVAGVTRLTVGQMSWDMMFAQVFFSVYALTMTFPVIEGMLFRKDNASVPLKATLLSTLLSLVVLTLGYFILLL